MDFRDRKYNIRFNPAEDDPDIIHVEVGEAGFMDTRIVFSIDNKLTYAFETISDLVLNSAWFVYAANNHDMRLKRK